MNLDYGSAAPGAPQMFIDGAQLEELWMSPERQYLLTSSQSEPSYEELFGSGHIVEVAQSGGKVLLTNEQFSGY